MLNRKTVVLAVAMAGILATSGMLAMLARANGPAQGSMPSQIDPADLMSKAKGLPELKIENLF